MNQTDTDYQTQQYLLATQQQEERLALLRADLEKTRKRKQARLRFVGMGALSLWLVAIFMLVAPNVGYMVDFFAPGAISAVEESISGPLDIDKSAFGEVLYEKPTNLELPPADPAWKGENRLIIDKVGLNTAIREDENWDDALRYGVWMTPGMGNPELESAPMVLAAHRYGFLAWSNAYRRETSFFNLPKLENGDLVSVVWNGRIFEYEVFEGYTGPRIENYKADLVLYTCEVLNSSDRVIRGARLLRVTGIDGQMVEVN